MYIPDTYFQSLIIGHIEMFFFFFFYSKATSVKRKRLLSSSYNGCKAVIFFKSLQLVYDSCIPTLLHMLKAPGHTYLNCVTLNIGDLAHSRLFFFYLLVSHINISNTSLILNFRGWEYTMNQLCTV